MSETRRLSGLDYLETGSSLLQRVRAAHPTRGLFEAADLQWWWRNPRPTDEIGQLFWFNEAGRPVAAAILTDWTDWVSLTPIFLPDVDPTFVADVVARGLAHAAEQGIEAVELEVDRSDDVMRTVLFAHRFELRDEAFLAESWLAAESRPPVSPLHDGYRIADRTDTGGLSHHMTSKRRNHSDVEDRLRQTPLYRPDLDLGVYDRDDVAAGYGLFWFDPVTMTGLVEPMRTEEEHQRRGLARHIITTGVDRLARAGAERVKVCFETDNPGARDLYLSVGFEPVKETDLFAGPTS